MAEQTRPPASAQPGRSDIAVAAALGLRPCGDGRKSSGHQRPLERVWCVVRAPARARDPIFVMRLSTIRRLLTGALAITITHHGGAAPAGRPPTRHACFGGCPVKAVVVASRVAATNRQTSSPSSSSPASSAPSSSSSSLFSLLSSRRSQIDLLLTFAPPTLLALAPPDVLTC